MKKTDFGYSTVTSEEKTARVDAVFTQVTDHYDKMNDFMSFGLHRLWKKMLVAMAQICPDEQVLDVASGTGDLVPGISRKLGAHGALYATDRNCAMLVRGRDKMINRGIMSNVHWVQASGEQLPFAPLSFDCVVSSFGLRNMTDKLEALRAMHTVLRYGGRLLILEFSKVTHPLLAALYDRYSFSVIPKLGSWVAKDDANYRYLVESIRKHPTQGALCEMLGKAGFDEVRYHNLCGGIVAIHRAYKF